MTIEKINLLEMKLELVPIPVSDVDHAITFYQDQVGFILDHDVTPNETMRVVQLTPPGSACSILISKGLPEISQMRPGCVKGLHLVVTNISQTRETLQKRGVIVSEITDMGGGVMMAGFQDPDGNSWALQELSF
jgi:predicted enzyme related to lactoylglutathione lyase